MHVLQSKMLAGLLQTMAEDYKKKKKKKKNIFVNFLCFRFRKRSAPVPDLLSNESQFIDQL